MSSRITDLEGAMITNQETIATERKEREAQYEQLRSEMTDLRQLINNRSSSTLPTSSSDTDKTREPICVIGGFYPQDRDSVLSMLSTTLKDVHGFKKIQPMGAVPKVAFIEFTTVDDMHNFRESFNTSHSNSKMWAAPKRAQDKMEM
eukprot:3366976-Karenia_brevis.AAC.1